MKPEKNLTFAEQKDLTPTPQLDWKNMYNTPGDFYFGYIKLDGTNTILPVGWSSSQTSATVYKVTHNLNRTSLGSGRYDYGVILTPMTTGAGTYYASLASPGANDFSINLSAGVDVSFMLFLKK